LADGGMASFSAAKTSIEQELEPARRRAEHRLDVELQRLSGAALERISEEIPRLAAGLAAVAGPHLDGLAVALQQLRYAASMVQNLRGDFLDILDQIEPSATPAALDAQLADTPQEPPAEVRRRITAAEARCGVPSMYVQQFEHVPLQVEIEAEPVEPAVAVVGPASEPAEPAVAEAPSEPASEPTEPAAADGPRPRRRGK
jgi:hypothetical protein